MNRGATGAWEIIILLILKKQETNRRHEGERC